MSKIFTFESHQNDIKKLNILKCIQDGGSIYSTAIIDYPKNDPKIPLKPVSMEDDGLVTVDIDGNLYDIRIEDVDRIEESIINLWDKRAKKFSPKYIEIITTEGHFKLKRSDFYVGGNGNSLSISYYQNLAQKYGNVLLDGEPDYLCFDIRFTKSDEGIKTLVDITYGDKMVSEFVILPNSKVEITHYNGEGSFSDPETMFSFTDNSLSDLVSFFNRFTHGLNLHPRDFKFLDKNRDSFIYQNMGKKMPITGTLKLNPLPIGKKILVIDNTKTKDESFTKNIINYLSSRGIAYILISSPSEMSKIGKESILGVISSGSNYNVNDEDSYDKINTTKRCLKKYKVPFMGICFGCQVLIKIYGGKIVEMKNRIRDKVVLDSYLDIPIFDGVDLSMVQVSFDHKHRIYKMPPKFSSISKFDGMVVAVKKNDKDIFGTLFHPENIPWTNKILDNFIQICVGGVPHEEFTKGGIFH